jgi:hypothetical protein
LYFEVHPVPTQPKHQSSAFIEELSGDKEVNRMYHTYQMALAAQKERTDSSKPVVSEDTRPLGDRKTGQFQYRAKVKDSDIAQHLYDRAMSASIIVTPGELLAVSPDLRKLFVESCKVNRIPVYSVTMTAPTTSLDSMALSVQLSPLYMAPIMELDVQISRKHPEVALYDTGAELVCVTSAFISVVLDQIQFKMNLDYHRSSVQTPIPVYHADSPAQTTQP